MPRIFLTQTARSQRKYEATEWSSNISVQCKVARVDTIISLRDTISAKVRKGGLKFSNSTFAIK